MWICAPQSEVSELFGDPFWIVMSLNCVWGCPRCEVSGDALWLLSQWMRSLKCLESISQGWHLWHFWDCVFQAVRPQTTSWLCVWCLISFGCVSSVWELWNFVFFPQEFEVFELHVGFFPQNVKSLGVVGGGSSPRYEVSELFELLVPGVFQCGVLEMVPCLCPNIWGLWVSLGYVCPWYDYELFFSLGPGTEDS